MSRRPAALPRWVRWAVGRALPRDRRREMLGDLDELFREPGEGPASRDTGARWSEVGNVIVWGVTNRVARLLRPLATLSKGEDGTMNGWINGVRVAVRSLLRQPGFTAVAIVTLALEIGANTAIFSLIDGALLRPLPYTDPDGLVYLSDGHEDFGGSGINQSIPNLLDLPGPHRLVHSRDASLHMDARQCVPPWPSCWSLMVRGFTVGYSMPNWSR